MYDFYNDDVYGYDSFYEGANLDIRAKLKEASKLYKKNMKDIRDAIKAGEYNNARRNIETLRRSLADLREDIEKTEAGNIDSVILALFTTWSINWLRSLIAIVLAIPTAGVSIGIDQLKSMIEAWAKPVIKANAGEDLTMDDLNAYKNTALERMNYLIGTLKRLDKSVEKLANTKGKKVKATATEIKKESATEDFKRALYEACNNGLISLDEREELLDKTRTNMVIEEANTNTYGFEYLSNEDKFKQVRRVLYKRYDNGEISLDEREELIMSARQRFYN